MNTRRRAAVLLFTLVALALAGRNASAGITLQNGKWRDGRIVWYYNGALVPAGITHADFLALVNQAFGLWSAACNISVQYGGTTTTTPIEALQAGKVVVGFSAMAPAGGDSVIVSNDPASHDYYLTGGFIRIANDLVPYQLERRNLLYLVVHEIGHLLNLGHSDDPLSVMYVNNTQAIISATDPYHLHPDDMTTCASLYGGRGLQPVVDHATDPFVPDSRYRLGVDVGFMEWNGGDPIEFGSARDTWRPVDRNAVDVVQQENFPWVRVTWDSPPARSARLQVIAPNGDVVVDNWPFGTGPMARGYQPVRVEMRVNGRWKARVFVNGAAAAEVEFRTVNGVEAPPKLEVAAMAEPAAGGGMAFRTVRYSRSAVVASSVYANGDYASDGSRFARASGANRVELWARSDVPRYRPGSGCGQSATSADLARLLTFTTDATGRIVSDAIDVEETGTLLAYSVRANIQAAGGGSVGVYVAAQLPGTGLVFRQPDGSWSTSQAPIVTMATPGAVNLDVIRDLDTRTLPAGTTFFVGYGTSVEQLVANRQYRAVRTF